MMFTQYCWCFSIVVCTVRITNQKKKVDEKRKKKEEEKEGENKERLFLYKWQKVMLKKSVSTFLKAESSWIENNASLVILVQMHAGVGVFVQQSSIPVSLLQRRT